MFGPNCYNAFSKGRTFQKKLCFNALSFKVSHLEVFLVIIIEEMAGLDVLCYKCTRKTRSSVTLTHTQLHSNPISFPSSAFNAIWNIPIVMYCMFKGAQDFGSLGYSRFLNYKDSG
jgi:hypothetical protein